jgi:hypothetical protein
METAATRRDVLRNFSEAPLANPTGTKSRPTWGSKVTSHKEIQMTRDEYMSWPEPHNDAERDHLAYLTTKLGAERVKNEQKKILTYFRIFAPIMSLPRVDLNNLTPREKEILGTTARLEGQEYAQANAALILSEARRLGEV